MTKQILPLTAYTEEQRKGAQARFALIKPFLEDGVPLRTARRWVADFRKQGL